MKIFISHSSEDKDLVDLFVQFILRLGLGINDEDIFCTSLQGYKINSGENFPSEIKKKLVASNVVIIMISQNYKKSEICLNEMGATWILDKKRITFVIDNVTYEEVGFLLINDQIERISSENDLDNFKDSIQSLLQKNENKVSIWNDNKQKFLSSIRKIDCSDTTASNTKQNQEITENEMNFLRTIDNSLTQSMNPIGISMDLEYKKSFVELILRDLVNKELLQKKGSYYTLTEKANRIIYNL